jgi:hypothetical protein
MKGKLKARKEGRAAMDDDEWPEGVLSEMLCVVGVSVSVCV